MCLAGSASLRATQSTESLRYYTKYKYYILLATLEHAQLHQGGLEGLLVLPAFPALQHKPALGRVFLA